MQYVQLDTFNGNISLVCKDDGSGEVRVFDSLEEAEDTLAENCQDGIIVPLAPVLPVLKTTHHLYSNPFSKSWSTEYDKVVITINELLDGDT